ncbi:MAG TPA: DNA-directed RNA polymerase subunit omega, partial [bacterium]|nr:DNA-directed RNA polymerase subunit omega [bacterium]
MDISNLDKILTITHNRYLLTLAVAQRAEELFNTATLLSRRMNPVSIAIRELAEDKLKIRAP